MKKLLCLLSLFFVLGTVFAQNVEINGCAIVRHYYGAGETLQFECYGNVFVVTAPNEHADLYVKVVNSPKYATYKIFRCTDKPRSCGEWRFVTDRKQAKFTVKFVKDNEDFRIYYTDNRSSAGFF
ncbi:MAG: hypothetical protein LBN95_06985 [Prevotellaceae bacterium]|jgi:hypothetical protein|nr:hypothetical protein [Prevotellaceae bacterium]